MHSWWDVYNIAVVAFFTFANLFYMLHTAYKIGYNKAKKEHKQLTEIEKKWIREDAHSAGFVEGKELMQNLINKRDNA